MFNIQPFKTRSFKTRLSAIKDDKYWKCDEQHPIINDFLEKCFYDIRMCCLDTDRKVITRDYSFVPKSLDMNLTKTELSKRIKEDKVTRGDVHVWISSDRVLNWCIDHIKYRL